MFGEERPDVEILHSVPLANEMLGTTLAEAQHKETVSIEPASLGTPSEQLMQVFQGQRCKPFKVDGVQRLERPLRYEGRFQVILHRPTGVRPDHLSRMRRHRHPHPSPLPMLADHLQIMQPAR